ncbi:hypothetical protein RvY_03064 [Ramazzottius varieornatus]|uniref:Uncharacterized protein n=1 Tax=Ramazzottius varieornatus TaxID=947166 RepID=A0A1D1USI2_RAMVA|nr:hypothetical protein RvY_03064 [Ramazzottius varieornatus]
MHMMYQLLEFTVPTNVEGQFKVLTAHRHSEKFVASDVRGIRCHFTRNFEKRWFAHPAEQSEAPGV